MTDNDTTVGPDTFGIEIDSTHEGLDVDDNGWEHNRWTVTLTKDGRTMVTDYKMGTGLVGEPTLTDVLGSLRLDAEVEEFDEYDDILAEMPYSKARKMEQAIRESHRKTKYLLGDDWEAFLGTEFDG